MFRKPRDQPTAASQLSMVPSIGRPPTPPFAEPESTTRSATPGRTMTSKPPIPVLGRSQTTARSTGSNRTIPAGKAKGKINGSILNFFKKAESTLDPDSVPKEEHASLFFEDSFMKSENVSPPQIPTPPQESGETSPDKAALRYNEDQRAVKRRRTSDHGVAMAAEHVGEAGDKRHSDSLDGPTTGPSSVDSGAANPDGKYGPQKKEDWLDNTPTEESPNAEACDKNLANGPFVEDPESEDDMIRHWASSAFENPKSSGKLLLDEALVPARVDSELPENNFETVPSLHREGTSIVGGDGFEGVEDFIDEEFPEDGEEYMERLWMKEQEGLELGVEDEGLGDDLLEMKGETDGTTSPGDPAQGDDGASSCPICSESLEGITSEVSHSERSNVTILL
jgi:DNA cross-link repair 1A protein